MKIGTKIRTLRNLKNMKQEDLANKANLSPHYLSEIENDLKSPRLNDLQAIIDALDVGFESFLSLDDSVIFNNNNNKVEQQGNITNETNKELMRNIIHLIEQQDKLLNLIISIFDNKK